MQITHSFIKEINMSNDKTNPTVTATPAPEPTLEDAKDAAADVVQSKFQKSKTFVKTHKQTLLGGALLTGLVGVSAYLGRQTAHTDVHFHQPLEIVSTEVEDAQEVLENDQTT